jgi:hypothetical protein
VRKTDVEKWRRYFAARNEGLGVEAACRRARVSKSVAYQFERNDPKSSGLEAAQIIGVSIVAGNLVAQPLSPEASRALDDFAYFRRRYFGRESTPWQIRAAYQILEAIHSDDREYIVINVPPGSGKSTLFTCDIPTWLIARDRTIRVQIGSRTERQARMYVTRIKRALEREAPLRADADSLAKGIAFDADACLLDDYGAFKPEGRSDLWAANALVVRQQDQTMIDDKEPTLSAWGQDSGFLGGRFDFIIWDDLVDQRNTRTEESRDKLREWWVTEAETRLEPSGALVLQGQRIHRNDLYRYALDQTTLDDAQKYRHIIYRAHDESLCQEEHDPKTAKAWPEGCLIDPHRIPWRILEAAKRNNPRVYSVQYQQEDGDTEGGLVDPAWIYGGVDSEGWDSPGSLDKERRRYEIPHHLKDGKGWSFVTVDPSPTEWWGVIWWVYDEATNNRYIIDIARRRMNPEQFLSLNMDTFEFTGLIHDMRTKSIEVGAPIRDVVVEVNAAQRWLLQQPHIQKYMQVTGLRFLPHTTSRNKSDPEFGVESLGDYFRQGRIRIPHADLPARRSAEPFIEELLAYPDGDTDDLVMSAWFHTLAVTNMAVPRQKAMYRQPRPSWVGSRRGLSYAH